MSTGMSLARFRTLCGQYGTSFERWPDNERAAAQELRRSSGEARRIHDDELRLERVIERASSAREATLWVNGEQDAALERLCSAMANNLARDAAQMPDAYGICARLAAVTLKIRFAGRGWRQAIWITAGSGAFGCCGIWIGQFLASVPQADLLSALQMTLLGGH